MTDITGIKMTADAFIYLELGGINMYSIQILIEFYFFSPYRLILLCYTASLI